MSGLGAKMLKLECCWKGRRNSRYMPRRRRRKIGSDSGSRPVRAQYASGKGGVQVLVRGGAVSEHFIDKYRGGGSKEMASERCSD